MALAIGFNRVLRDTLFTILGDGCLCTRTVLTLTFLGEGGTCLVTVGIGLTAVGITNPCLGFLELDAMGGGRTLSWKRVTTTEPVGVRCWLGTLRFFDSTFETLGDRWRRVTGCRPEKVLSFFPDSDTATPCHPLELFPADSRPKI
nr:hypothetical protein [Nostoc sp. PCC 7524]